MPAGRDLPSADNFRIFKHLMRCHCEEIRCHCEEWNDEAIPLKNYKLGIMGNFEF